MTEWEPATETEAAMRDALRANDQELYFRILARAELLLPVSADALSGQAPMGWGTWTTSGRTHVLAFTSAAALHACLADNATSARRMPYPELAGNWPNVEWWLAVNPGLPIEGYLPAWFVSQLARGDVRLPGRTMGARARVERAETVARARATAAVPTRAAPTDTHAAPGQRAVAGAKPVSPAMPAQRDQPVSPAMPAQRDQPVSPAVPASRIAGVSPVPPDSRISPSPGTVSASPAAPNSRTMSASRGAPESVVPAGRTVPASASSAVSTSPDPVPPAPVPHRLASGRGAAPDSSAAPAARIAPVSPAAPVVALPSGPTPDALSASSPGAESAGPGRAATSGLPTRPGARPGANGPVGIARVSRGPVGVAPVSGAPVDAAPVSGAPVDAAPVSGAPVAAAPVSGAPAAPVVRGSVGVAAVPGGTYGANGGSPAGAVSDASPDGIVAPPGQGRQPAAGTGTTQAGDSRQFDEPAGGSTFAAAVPAQVPAPSTLDPSVAEDRTGERDAPLPAGGEVARQAATATNIPEAFAPANATEESLFTAARDGSTDSFLSTLLLARVLLPVSSVSRPGAKPGDDDFVWRKQTLDDETYVVVFTSAERLSDHFAGPVETVDVNFLQLIRHWPDEAWRFAINPGTPVGAKLPGAQIIALASWAVEVGLGDDADAGETEEPPTTDDAAPGPTPEQARHEPVRPTMMQKTVVPGQVAYYLDRGYDRVSGFVHRAHEVAHLTTPSKLRVALGLGYSGSPFAGEMDEVYVLRWPAYQPSLYRIPYGGQNEAAMRAMEGWVIERPPFRGNGFAPGDSTDVVAEFKVDSIRLPHGAQLWRVAADGSQKLVATLDSDGPIWRRTEED